MNMNTSEIAKQASDAINVLINDSDRATPVQPTDLGMSQVYGAMYIDSDTQDLIVPKPMLRTLNYYAGFEYIDEEFITNVGHWIIFSYECDRIRDVVDQYSHMLEESDEV